MSFGHIVAKIMVALDLADHGVINLELSEWARRPPMLRDMVRALHEF
jgi:hypothetical protein